MKKVILSLVAVAAMMVTTGCSGGGDTTVQPATAPITVMPSTVIIKEVEPTKEVNGELFEGVRVSYDKSRVGCEGGQVDLTMSFKNNDEIDPFSFILEHNVDGSIVEFSNVNVGSETAITSLTDTIYIEPNGTDGVIRHGLIVNYYGAQIEKISSHYFDQPTCDVIEEEVVEEEESSEPEVK